VRTGRLILKKKELALASRSDARVRECIVDGFLCQHLCLTIKHASLRL
jgi:hypothetical protein